jgi:pimeloyl-ACP methyl ester carboxylesterase
LKALSDLNISCSQFHTIAACVRVWDFTPPCDNWKHLQTLGSKVHIWHSEDDCIVPFSDAQYLLEHLPDANSHFYTNMSHFHKLEEFTDLEKCLLV